MRKELSSTLNRIQLPKYHCLIVIQVKRIEDLSIKITGDLLQLSSLKYDVAVIIIVNEKLSRSIYDKFPLNKNKMLIISTEGEVYFNGNEPTDIFKYIEIGKQKFEESLNIFLDKVDETLLTVKKYPNYKMSLEFPKGAFG